jgi:lincosamide nucleotidyltransferase A/C/D/E
LAEALTSGQSLSIRADQVVELVDRLRGEGVTAWVDGGWGVDALVGEQTRPHADLDLVVDVSAIEQLLTVLSAQGFEVIRDWLPTAIALGHPDGREVDLHPVILTPDGGGDQVQRDGVTRWHYAAPTIGIIGGWSVSCCTVETQVEAHLGYEPNDTDRADMHVLAKRFGLRLPEPYGRP